MLPIFLFVLLASWNEYNGTEENICMRNFMEAFGDQLTDLDADTSVESFCTSLDSEALRWTVKNCSKEVGTARLQRNALLNYLNFLDDVCLSNESRKEYEEAMGCVNSNVPAKSPMIVVQNCSLIDIISNAESERIGELLNGDNFTAIRENIGPVCSYLGRVNDCCVNIVTETCTEAGSGAVHSFLDTLHANIFPTLLIDLGVEEVPESCLAFLNPARPTSPTATTTTVYTSPDTTATPVTDSEVPYQISSLIEESSCFGNFMLASVNQIIGNHSSNDTSYEPFDKVICNVNRDELRSTVSNCSDEAGRPRIERNVLLNLLNFLDDICLSNESRQELATAVSCLRGSSPIDSPIQLVQHCISMEYPEFKRLGDILDGGNFTAVNDDIGPFCSSLSNLKHCWADKISEQCSGEGATAVDDLWHSLLLHILPTLFFDLGVEKVSELCTDLVISAPATFTAIGTFVEVPYEIEVQYEMFDEKSCVDNFMMASIDQWMENAGPFDDDSFDYIICSDNCSDEAGGPRIGRNALLNLLHFLDDVCLSTKSQKEFGVAMGCMKTTGASPMKEINKCITMENEEFGRLGDLLGDGNLTTIRENIGDVCSFAMNLKSCWAAMVTVECTGEELVAFDHHLRGLLNNILPTVFIGKRLNL